MAARIKEGVPDGTPELPDLSKETYLTVSQVATRFSKTPQTVTRWITRGVSTPAGTIQLRAVRIGASYHVREAWLTEFILAQNPGLHAALARADEAQRRAEQRSLEKAREWAKQRWGDDALIPPTEGATGQQP
jgi:hypothetical protein